MSKIQIKAFILSKDGSIYFCQDSLAFNTAKRSFAVADGVTNSYHPEIVSQLLCKCFVEIENVNFAWDECFANNIHDKICRQWEENVAAIESNLSGRRLEHALMKRDNLPRGASTFAGIQIDSNSNQVHYYILGDSTFFAINSDGSMNAFSTNDTVAEGSMIKYTNHPHYVCADGHIYGQWLIGKVPFSSGYLMLMTDGCAEWFQEAFCRDKTIVEQLWDLKDNEGFEEVAAKCRKEGKMNDDLAIIQIKITDSCDDDAEVVLFPDYPPITYKAESAIIVAHDNSDDGNDVEQQDAVVTLVPEETIVNQPKYVLIDFENLSLYK